MMNNKIVNIVIIIELFIVGLIPLINRKYINLVIGGVLNKIILLCIAFLLTFENFIVGLLSIIGVILLITANSRNQSNFISKYDDHLEP